MPSDCDILTPRMDDGPSDAVMLWYFIKSFFRNNANDTQKSGKAGLQRQPQPGLPFLRQLYSGCSAPRRNQETTPELEQVRVNVLLMVSTGMISAYRFTVKLPVAVLPEREADSLVTFQLLL